MGDVIDRVTSSSSRKEEPRRLSYHGQKRLIIINSTNRGPRSKAWRYKTTWAVQVWDPLYQIHRGRGSPLRLDAPTAPFKSQQMGKSQAKPEATMVQSSQGRGAGPEAKTCGLHRNSIWMSFCQGRRIFPPPRTRSPTDERSLSLPATSRIYWRRRLIFQAQKNPRNIYFFGWSLWFSAVNLKAIRRAEGCWNEAVIYLERGRKRKWLLRMIQEERKKKRKKLYCPITGKLACCRSRPGQLTVRVVVKIEKPCQGRIISTAQSGTRCCRRPEV